MVAELLRFCAWAALGRCAAAAASSGELRGARSPNGDAGGAPAPRALTSAGAAGADTGAPADVATAGAAASTHQLSPAVSFVLGVVAVLGIAAVCWAVVMCWRRQRRAAAEQKAQQAAAVRGGELPVLLGAHGTQGLSVLPHKDNAAARSDDETNMDPPPKTLPEFLRATLNNVQEGLDWNDNDLHVEPPDTLPSHDCTRGCDVSCW